MEIDPPQWWQKTKLFFWWYWPLEPRRKIKRFLKFGDDFQKRGHINLAEHCYGVSKRLAEQAGTVHLLKKIDERLG